MPDPVTPGVRTSPIYRIRGKTGFDYPDPRATPENTEELENMNLTERGTAKKRDGYDEYNSNQISESGAAKDVTYLVSLPFKAGTLFASFAGTKFYEETNSTRTDRTGSLSLTDNTDKRWRSVFLDDSMIATNGTDETVRWTGSGNATDMSGGANIPWTTCRDFAVHNNLLVALRPTISSVDQTTRVMWCDINPKVFTVDVTNFPVDNRAEISDAGPPIIGGVDFNGFLYICKEDGIYQTILEYDTGFVELRILSSIRGFEPIATNSILTRVGNTPFMFLVARDGAYVINPDNSFINVSRPLQEEWSNLNQGRLKYAVSFIRQKDHQVRTLLSASSTVGHDRVFVWDWDTGDVWFDKPADAINYADSWIISNKEYDIFGTTDGYIQQANDPNKTTDNGSGINWKVLMQPNDLGFPGVDKNIISLNSYFRSQSGQQTHTLQFLRDERQSTTITKTLSVGSSVTYGSGLLYDNGVFYSGGVNQKVVTFINRDAETFAPEWSGSDAVDIQGYSVEYEIS